MSGYELFSVNKATGPDKSSERLFKNCNKGLLHIIHRVYNISLQLRKLPRMWKLDESTPVNEKSLPKADDDLQLVTLPALLGKCFERTILPQIVKSAKTILHIFSKVRLSVCLSVYVCLVPPPEDPNQTWNGGGALRELHEVIT